MAWSASVWLATILVACGHGELEIRIAELSRQIATNDSDARLYLERGNLFRLHQDWPAATADFDRAEALSPDFAMVVLARARLERDAGQLTQARKSFDAYLEKAPTDGVALIERARMRGAAGETRAALADYTDAISLVTDPLPEYFLERAELAVRCGDRALAVRGLDEGLKRLGVVVTLQSKAIELALEEKDYADALQRLETILARAKRPELWLEKKGEILRAAGRNAEALLAYAESAAAITKLPGRLQTTPNMEQLKSRLQRAQEELRVKPPPATTNR